MSAIDTLIQPRWVVPVSGTQRVLSEHAVAVHNGRIVAVLPRAQAAARFTPEETIDLPTHALLPGLVNAHTHTAMSLMRGIANDLPLMPWLNDHIWPAEAQHLARAFVADGSRLAFAEMLRGGTTCCNDMYYFPDVIAQTAIDVGLRAAVGLQVINVPTRWAATADEYIDKALDVHAEFGAHERITPLFAPHAPYTADDAALTRIRDLAADMGLRIHMHVHETAAEIQASETADGERPLARLQRLGLLNPELVAVHMTQLNAAEIRQCAAHGVHVVHSPESNLKLASGTCPVQALLDAGINVALGTDGAASNNDLDMLGEMRTAALIGKVAAGDAAAVSADTALHMATLGGARALGLEQDIGSIEAGKAADLCAIDLDTLETRPVFDCVATIVYSADRRQVTDTWVGGQRLLRARRLTTLDERAISTCADHWQARLNTTLEYT